MSLTIVQANNPLALTTGTNISPYSATGSLTSGAGYNFDTFSTPQQGFAAGVQYILNHAGETVGQLIGSAFNGDQASVEAQGVNLNDIVSPSNASQIALGIASNEGGLSAFGGADALTGSTTAGSGAASGSILGSAGNVAQANPNSPVAAALTWLNNIGPSILWVVLGIVVLIAALYMLAVEAKVAPPPADIARAALA